MKTKRIPAPNEALRQIVPLAPRSRVISYCSKLVEAFLSSSSDSSLVEFIIIRGNEEVRDVDQIYNNLTHAARRTRAKAEKENLAEYAIVSKETTLGVNPKKVVVLRRIFLKKADDAPLANKGET